jgi:transposase, IS5 family
VLNLDFLRFGILLLGDSRFPDSRPSALGKAMSNPRDGRQKDFLLPALDQIIDMGHPPVRLAALIDWNIHDLRFSSVCETGSG